MKKHLFKCSVCDTVLSIETNLEDKQIHKAPPCPCGKTRMDSMQSDIYKYGNRIGLWD